MILRGDASAKRRAGRAPALAVLAAAALALGAGTDTGSSPKTARADGPLQDRTGPRYRIGVEQDGIHRITAQELSEAGMPLDGVDPRRLALYRGQTPVALSITGQDDGRLDAGDAILFYGQRLRTTPGQFDFFGRSLPVVLGERLYTDEQAYWLVEEDGGAERIDSRDARPELGGPRLEDHRQRLRVEGHRWFYRLHFSNDDPWLDFRFQPGPAAASQSETFELELDAPRASGAPARLRVEMLAASQAVGAAPDHHVRLYWGDAPQPVAEAFWDGATRHRIEASLPASALTDGVNPLRIEVVQDQAVASEDIYLDWIELDYDRQLRPVEGRLGFELAPEQASRVRIAGVQSPDTLVWDVSQPDRAVALVGAEHRAQGAGSPWLELSLPAGGPRQVALAEPEAARSPSSVRRVEPDGLESVAGADYIVIAPEALMEGSRRLADYRGAQGLRSVVVDIDDLYNRFNDGVLHPRAIRRFLIWARDHWAPPAPRYLVLVGDGHWNLHGYNPAFIANPPNLMPPNLAWVDPYQGLVDSSNRLAVLDDEDPLPDLMVGRIPVRDEAELAVVLGKIEAYEAQAPADWMRRHVFAVDNTPDRAGDFVGITERLLAEPLLAGLDLQRRYLDDHPDAASLKSQLIEDINDQGALMLHYFGHGARERWAHEAVLSLPDLPALRNAQRLPIVLTWTCLDGTWDFPNGEGMAESLLRMQGGGAVASFSSTGLGVATGHDVMQDAVYEAYLAQEAGTLGELTLAARRAIHRRGIHRDLIDTYTLFGDPALRLPEHGRPPSPTPAPTAPPSPTPDPDAPLLLPYLLQP